MLSAKSKAGEPPKTVLVIKPVDGGRAAIGLIECPICGQQHFTTKIMAGELLVYCGEDHSGDGWNTLSIEVTV